MAIKQLSIFVENKQGRLVEITKILAQNNVDLLALSIADTKDFGILRIIVDDPERASLALQEGDVVFKSVDVVAVEIPHRPGGLSETLSALDDAGINVEYTYAFLTKTEDGAFVVLRVRDNDAAEQTLKNAGYRVLGETDKID